MTSFAQTCNPGKNQAGIKLILTLVLALTGLFANQAVSAKAANQAQDKLQLAMIDPSMLDFELPATTEKKHGARTEQKLPENCMQWNVHQLNRKAGEFSTLINKYARQYKIDHHLIRAVIAAESCYKKKALSSAGARGLMQLIPETAERFGVKNSYDPEQNIRGGVKYLRFLFDRFKGDLEKIVAAYNAGEGKVDRYKGIPPYKETKQYVKNVINIYNKLRAPLLQKTQNTKKKHSPLRLTGKPGRGGWQYNKARAPHLFKH